MFHARYHQEWPTVAGHDYRVLAASGRGQFVGCILGVQQLTPGWFGEGDEKMFVDGAARATLAGTGTEDYFLDAWDLRESSSVYYGFPISSAQRVRSLHALYRFHADGTGRPVTDWRTEYDRGTQVKPGMIYQGSGTTPHLFGDLVAICDNAEPRMNVMFLRRSAGREVGQIPATLARGYAIVAVGRGHVLMDAGCARCGRQGGDPTRAWPLHGHGGLRRRG